MDKFIHTPESLYSQNKEMKQLRMTVRELYWIEILMLAFVVVVTEHA
jgi:hypothetical protein